MDLDAALGAFGASIKARKAAEINYLGATDPDARAVARRDWVQAVDTSRDCGLRLLAAPIRHPADLVIKARALRWHCDGAIRIENPVEIGGAQELAEDTPFEIVALHYLARDLFQLAG